MPDGREKGRGNNSIRQSGMAGGSSDRDRDRPSQRNGDPRRGEPSNPFYSVERPRRCNFARRPHQARLRARSHVPLFSSPLQCRPPSLRLPSPALPGQRRGARISVRNLDLTLWRPFIAAPNRGRARGREEGEGVQNKLQQKQSDFVTRIPCRATLPHSGGIPSIG